MLTSPDIMEIGCGAGVYEIEKSRGLKFKTTVYREIAGPGIVPGDQRCAFDIV